MRYRKNCHASFKKNYNQSTENEGNYDKNSALKNFVALIAAKRFVNDSVRDVFNCRKRGKLYIKKLANHE